MIVLKTGYLVKTDKNTEDIYLSVFYVRKYRPKEPRYNINTLNVCNNRHECLISKRNDVS